MSKEESTKSVEKKEKNGAGAKKKTEKKTKAEPLYTHDGHILTPNESKFIDEYIKLGNARQAYINAYPNTNPKTAAQLGHRVYTKVYVNSEINYRLELAKTESIADATEIMQYFTDVMRGEIKDQFGLEAPLSERTRAAVELARRMIDIPQKSNGVDNQEVKITLDWGRPQTEEQPLGVSIVMNREEKAESTEESEDTEQ